MQIFKLILKKPTYYTSQVFAADRDQGDNADVQYRVSGESPYFQVGLETGKGFLLNVPLEFSALHHAINAIFVSLV